MELYKKIFSFIILWLIITFSAIAQQSLQDSAFFMQTTDSIISLYKNEMKGNLNLYNGSEYMFSGHNINGFAYFKSPKMLKGSVYYDGNLYNDVSMYYDLVNDELIILNYTKNYPIKLVTDKVAYFTIDGCRFINGSLNSNTPFFETAGFYQELYSNKTSVFAKKEKQLKLSAKAEDNTASYVEYDEYFIYSNNKVFPVVNERSVLNAFQTTKGELKKFIRDSKIDFKKNFEDAVIKTAEHFDQIEN
jgi:hypothetical protein